MQMRLASNKRLTMAMTMMTKNKKNQLTLKRILFSRFFLYKKLKKKHQNNNQEEEKSQMIRATETEEKKKKPNGI